METYFGVSPSAIQPDANPHAVKYIDKTHEIVQYLRKYHLHDGVSKGIRIEEKGYAINIVPFLKYSQNKRPSVSIVRRYFPGIAEWLLQRSNGVENDPLIAVFQHAAREKLFPFTVERGYSIAHPTSAKFTPDLTQCEMTFELEV